MSVPETITAGVTTAKKTWADEITRCISGLYSGARSVVKVYADGVGDQASGGNPGDVYGSNQVIAQADLIAVTGNVSAAAGYAFLGATRSSATAGAGQGLTVGRVYKDTTIVAWAYCTIAGGALTLVRGVNISSATRTGAGVIAFTLVNGAANTLCPVPSLVSGAAGYTILIGGGGGLTATQFTVYIYDAAGVAADQDFTVIVTGG